MTSRGSRVIGTLFEDMQLQDQEEKNLGRSDELIQLRNERLCARLYWYKKNTKWDHKYVLEQLQCEFDIEEITIAKIITRDEWLVYMRQLKNMNNGEGPKTSFFKSKWWWMDWVTVNQQIK